MNFEDIVVNLFRIIEFDLQRAVIIAEKRGHNEVLSEFLLEGALGLLGVERVFEGGLEGVR